MKTLFKSIFFSLKTGLLCSKKFSNSLTAPGTPPYNFSAVVISVTNSFFRTTFSLNSYLLSLLTLICSKLSFLLLQVRSSFFRFTYKFIVESVSRVLFLISFRSVSDMRFATLAAGDSLLLVSMFTNGVSVSECGSHYVWQSRTRLAEDIRKSPHHLLHNKNMS